MKALYKVVWSEEFNPDDMADYMRNKIRPNPNMQYPIERYQDDAWAVKDFLEHNKITIPKP